MLFTQGSEVPRFRVSRLLGLSLVVAAVGVTGCPGAPLSRDLVSITLTPDNASVSVTTQQQFVAKGHYSDNSEEVITGQVSWKSSDEKVATISSDAGTQGLATGVTPGTAKITASVTLASGEKKEGTAQLTVKEAALTSIAITPTNVSIAAGYTRDFVATGTFSDNSTQNLTGQVTWSSSNPNVARISNEAGSHGRATGLAAGTTTLTAALELVSGTLVQGTVELTVTPAALVSLAVTPAEPSIAKGNTQQLTATGSFSDGSTQELTTQVSWSSSDEGVATVSNDAGSEGLATGAAEGTVTLAATLGTISGSTSVTVTPPTLEAISVTRQSIP